MEVFGSLLSPQDVEDAVVGIYRTWFPEYLRQVELKHGFARLTLPRPPSPASYHGGVDEESWTQDDLPELIVIVRPAGEPERHGNGDNSQAYTVLVSVQWRGSGSSLAERPEDEARAVASYLGAASMLLLQKPPSICERLQMRRAPLVEFPLEGDKTLAQVTSEYELWLPSIVNESQGPTSELPSESPEYPGEAEGEWGSLPEVKSEHLTIVGENP